MIYCDKAKCFYSNGECCKCANVWIDESGECTTFQDYTELPKYQQEYFVAVHNSTVTGKERRRGAEVYFEGFKFFTEDNVDTMNIFDLRVTEARTGVYCGYLADVKRKWETFKEKINHIPSVDILPEVEAYYDDGTKLLKYITTTTAAEAVQAQKFIDAVQGGYCTCEE